MLMLFLMNKGRGAPSRWWKSLLVFLLLAILRHRCCATKNPMPDSEEDDSDDSDDSDDGQWAVNRFQILEIEVGLNGSAKGDNLCSYHEYQFLLSDDSVRSQFGRFQQKKAMLDELLKKFADTNSAMLTMEPVQIEELLQQEAADRFQSSQRAHQIVTVSKGMLYEMFQSGWPGSFLDLWTFKEGDEYGVLKKIFQFAAIEAKSVDIFLLNSMLNRHKNARQMSTMAQRPLRRTIIEGAGPVGLLAAFELFLAGMDVFIVNDRTEYVRSHRIDSTNKLFFQTRYLLGSAHRALFGNVNDYQILSGKIPQLSNKNLEKHLLQALQRLAAATKHAFGGGQISDVGGDANEVAPRLGVALGIRFEGIKTGVNQKTGEPAHLGILRRQNGQTMQWPVDVLLCAGGANDVVRDTLLGKMQALSPGVNYGKALFLKDQSSETIFNEAAYNSELEMVELRPFLEKYGFFQHLKSHPLAQHFFTPAQLDQFEHKLWLGIKENRVDHEYAKKRLFILMLEDREALVIMAETPTALVELIDILEGHKQQQAREFRHTIERRWFAALLEFIYWHNDGQRQRHLPKRIEIEQTTAAASPRSGWLTFDPEPVNTTIFRYTLKVLPQPVAIQQHQGCPLVISAIGDAYLTPHFLSGIGISIGKYEAENIGNMLKMFHRNKIDLNQLAGNIEEMLKAAIVMGTNDVDKFIEVNRNAMHSIIQSRIFMPGSSASGPSLSSTSIRGKEVVETFASGSIRSSTVSGQSGSIRSDTIPGQPSAGTHPSELVRVGLSALGDSGGSIRPSTAGGTSSQSIQGGSIRPASANQLSGSIRPTSEQGRGSIRPGSEQPSGSIRPGFEQPSGSIRPGSEQPSGSIRPGSEQPSGSIRPGSEQPSGSIRPDSEQPSGSIRPGSEQPSGSIRPTSEQSGGSIREQGGESIRPVGTSSITTASSGSIRQTTGGSIRQTHHQHDDQSDPGGQKRQASASAVDQSQSSPKRQHRSDVTGAESARVAATQQHMSQLQISPSLSSGHHSQSVGSQQSGGAGGSIRPIESSKKEEEDKKGGH